MNNAATQQLKNILKLPGSTTSETVKSSALASANEQSTHTRNGSKQESMNRNRDIPENVARLPTGPPDNFTKGFMLSRSLKSPSFAGKVFSRGFTRTD